MEEALFEFLVSLILMTVFLLSPIWFLKLVHQSYGMLKKADVANKGRVAISWLVLNVIISIPIARLALVGYKSDLFPFVSISFQWALGVLSFLGIPVFMFFVLFFLLQRAGTFKRFPARFWSNMACMGISLTWTQLAYYLYESSRGG